MLRPLPRLFSCALALLAASLLASCGAPRERGIVLRLAGTQQGEQMREPFRAALRAFEREHPGLRVDVSEMDDDVYQQMGLVTLFVGGTPP
ncbi:MAG TPA: hypothetical protein VFU47_03205, partial [Armatimonadota bacterium]|nr:hypothetical protein [Armatimonadota bacterium]